jgi:YbbR domain-containing protein
MNQTPKRLFLSIFRNAGWKLLALAVAVVLWAVVATEPELSTFTPVRLEYRNLPEELEISSDPANTISLELRGPSGSLRGLEAAPAGAAVVLDMASVQTGERTFPIAGENVKLPRGVHLVRAVPSEVRFVFERRRSRSVAVTPRFTGEGQNGYRVERWVADPHEVEVEGPASRVARLSGVATDPVDVSALVGSAEFRVNAYLNDPFVRFKSPAQITVTVAMKKR